MPLIDDEGNLFGRWNLVDTMVLLLGLALVVGIGAVAVGDLDFDETESITVTVESVERHYMSTALAGIGECHRGATVVDVTVHDQLSPTNETARYHRLRVRASLNVTRTDGGWRFADQDVYVGGDLRLDFCSVRLTGTVVGIDEQPGNAFHLRPIRYGYA